MSRIGALWRLEAFLDRDDGLHPLQRLALLAWVMALQDDLLPPLAVEGLDPHGRPVRSAVLPHIGVAVTYRVTATGRARLLRIERLDDR